MPGGFDSVDHYERMGFKECPKCGTWVTQDGANYCPIDGTKLKEQVGVGKDPNYLKGTY